jgi:hypothetical protein
LGTVGKAAVADTIREAERKQADKYWAAVAAGLTRTPDADRFLARADQADLPPDSYMALGRSLAESISGARRLPIS